MSKGFVTIATGNESYYQMAHNLLVSYRFHSKEPLPFAIICDRENKYTRDFDDVVVKDDLSKSYMDKLSLLSIPPYKENIFIDADCLAYSDLSNLFSLMPESGVSCVGHKLPTSNTEDGWFSIYDIGEYAKSVKYIPQMHGGLIFFKDDALTKRIYSEAVQIADNYSNYKFKYFDKPADEPILALAIAAHAGDIIDVGSLDSQSIFCFFPSVKKVSTHIRSGFLSYVNHQGVIVDNVSICHWQNCNTKHHQYKNEVLALTQNNLILRSINSFKNTALDYTCDAIMVLKRIMRHFTQI